MIASAIPAMTGNGFAMRLGIFLEALARVAEVDLVVLPVGGSASASYELPARLGVFTGVLPLDDRFDTQFAMLMRIADPAERLAAFRTYGRPSYSACVTGSVVAYLRAIGRQRSYDLVHVGRIYMAEAGLAAAATGARLSLDLDEDDYVSQQSIAELRFATAGEAAAGWFRLEADAMDRMVRTFGDKFDRLWIASPEDRDTLAARHPDLDPIVINNAVDFPDNTERRDDGATLLFVGSFGYPPNAEGILWFADEIWPRLKARAKGRLRRPLSTIVIGANPPRRLRRLAGSGALARLLGRGEELVLTGQVPDLRPYYARASLAIAPLRAGRGTRLKLIEAAAEGVPVVATSNAAGGLPTEPPWAWIADDADAFADACAAALKDGEESKRRVARGRAMVAASFDRAKVVQGLAARFSALVGGPDRAQPAK